MTGNGVYKLSTVSWGMVYFCYTHIALFTSLVFDIATNGRVLAGASATGAARSRSSTCPEHGHPRNHVIHQS